jgi:hypothetical protein
MALNTNEKRMLIDALWNLCLLSFVLPSLELGLQWHPFPTASCVEGRMPRSLDLLE